jgi:uroporphyrin-III C-methyltransferase
MSKVYLVGAGPGGLDLLTIKAANLIAKADVILHDALVTDDILALAPLARKVCVGKRAGQPSTDQTFINRLLVASALGGGIVVRLKGGDPSVFGRASEEIAACEQSGIEVEIVPGITAASAAAAHIGVSLTQRNCARSIAFVTPSRAKGVVDNDDSWADAIVTGQSTAIYMGVNDCSRVQRTILARGLPPSTPVVFVQNVGRANATHIRSSLKAMQASFKSCESGPIVMLVGEAFAGVPELASGENQTVFEAFMSA